MIYETTGGGPEVNILAQKTMFVRCPKTASQLLIKTILIFV